MDDVPGVLQVLVTVGKLDASLFEDTAAAAFGAQVHEVGVRAVDPDAQAHGQTALQRGGVKDHQVGAVGFPNALADAVHHPGRLEDFLGERLSGSIGRIQHGQAPHGVVERDAGQEG